jgi:hypothetical protein
MVPAYFNEAERWAMVVAAEISVVNFLQLMNGNTTGKPFEIPIFLSFFEQIISRLKMFRNIFPFDYFQKKELSNLKKRLFRPFSVKN